MWGERTVTGRPIVMVALRSHEARSLENIRSEIGVTRMLH